MTDMPRRTAEEWEAKAAEAIEVASAILTLAFGSRCWRSRNDTRR